jgi:4-amino-4-deoxy-L-arabinose transferase-like glycosyltransferase
MEGDTRLLLAMGTGLLVIGIISVLLVRTVFGGISEHGPRTNDGWILLLLTMFCLPLGTLFSLLGGAKWLKNRSHHR